MLLHKCIYLYPSFSKMESNDLLRTIYPDFIQKSLALLYVQIFFSKNIYLFLLLILLKWCQTTCWWTINSNFQPEIICIASMWRINQRICIYLYPLNFSNGVRRHVEKDNLRFKPEIICNACCMCRFFCKAMYIFLPQYFCNGVKRHVEYDKLIFQPLINCVALCEESFRKYVIIFTPNLLKLGQTPCWKI